MCNIRAVGQAWSPNEVTLSNMGRVQRSLRPPTVGQLQVFNFFQTAAAIWNLNLAYDRMLTALASSAYRVVMIITSIILTNAFSYVPMIGPFLGFSFLCWVNA